MVIAKEGFNRPPREPIPAGLQHAVCYGVVDLGTQPPLPNSQYPGKKSHKVQLLWQLVDERRDFTLKDGTTVNERAVLSKEFTLSLGDKGNLRPFLESWRGRQFTAEELKGFDLSKLVGANCMLNVIHATVGRPPKTVDRIQSIAPLPKSMKDQKAEVEGDTIHFDFESYRGGALPERIPGWLRERIQRSDEWQAMPQEINGDPGPSDSNGPDDEDDPLPF